MAFRLYSYCKDCLCNKTSGWGFGFRKEGGCLFPDDPDITAIYEKCPYFQPREIKGNH